MASIPDATALQSPQLQFSRFTPTIDARGAAQQAEGIVQAGQAISGIANELSSQQQQQDKFKALTSYNDWNTQQNMGLEKAKRDAPSGAPDFTPSWQQQDQQSRQQFLQTIPESQRQEFTLKTQQDANNRLLHTQTWQTQQADQKVKDDVDVRLNQHSNTITANPLAYPDVIRQAHEELDAAPLPKIMIEEMKRRFASTAERASVDARVGRGEDPRDVARDVRQVPQAVPPAKTPTEAPQPAQPSGAAIPGANDNAKPAQQQQTQEGQAVQAPETKAGEAQAAKPFTYVSKDGAARTVSPEERDALIKTVIGEARGESDKGKAGVTWAALNRARQGGFGTTLLDVLTKPAAFEAVDKGALDKNWSKKDYDSSAKVVDDVLAGNVADQTNKATHYYSPSVQSELGRRPPPWASTFDETARIGTHVFFSDPDHPVHDDEKKGSTPGGYFQAPGLNIQYRIDPKANYGIAATRGAEPFKGIVVHDTGDDKPAMAQVMYGQSRDAFRGGSFGYHFYIDRDGSIIQGAPMDVRTNHVMPLGSKDREAEGIPLENKNAIGVAFVGQEGKETPQQIAAFQRLSSSLGSTYGFDPHASTFGHGELQGNKMAEEGMKGVETLRSGVQSPQQAAVPYPNMDADARRAALHNLNIAGRNITQNEISNGVTEIEHFGKASKDDQGRTALDRAIEQQTLTPNEIAKEKLKWQQAQMVFDAKAPLKNMTPDQWELWRDDHLMPREGEDTSISKAKWAAYKAAEKEWEGIADGRAKDPAMAVNADPRVKQAYKESRAAETGATATLVPRTPVAGATVVVPMSPQDAHRKVIEARMQAQADVGIDPAMRQPITRDEAIKLLGMGTKPSALNEKQFNDALKAASAKAQQVYGPDLGSQVFDSAVHLVITGKDNTAKAASFVRKIARGEMFTPDDIAEAGRLSDPNQLAMVRYAAPLGSPAWSEPPVRASARQVDKLASAAGQPPVVSPDQYFAPQVQTEASGPQPGDAHVSWLQQQLENPETADKAIAAYDAKFGKNAHVNALMQLARGGITTSTPPAVPDTRPWFQRLTSKPSAPASGYQGGSTPAAQKPRSAETQTPIPNPFR